MNKFLTQASTIPLSLSDRKENSDCLPKKQRFVCFLLAFLISALSFSDANAQLMQQQFTTALSPAQVFTNPTTGSTVSVVPTSATSNTYFNNGNGTTTNAQFDFAAVGVNATASAQTLTSNAGNLTWAKTTTGITGELVRVTNLAATAPTSLIVRATLNFTSVSSGTAAAVTFLVGSGFHTSSYTTSFGLGSPVQTASTVNSQFVIQTNSTNAKWGVSNNTSQSLNTAIPITWVINNSGVTLNYTAPDGNSYSVATGTYDLWLNTTRDVTAAAATTAGVALQNFAIQHGGGIQTFSLTNLLIDPIPTAPTFTNPNTFAGTNGAPTGFNANWGAVSGTTGVTTSYRFDVSSSSTFSSFVSGYNNLTVSAGSTNQAVSGLTSGTTYYYRVRTANAATVATNISGNSSVVPTYGGITSVTNGCTGNTVILNGLVPSTTNVITYKINAGSTSFVSVVTDASGNATFTLPTSTAGYSLAILGISIGSTGMILGSNNTTTLPAQTGITLSVTNSPAVSLGTTSTNLAYSSFNSPDGYSITYGAGAITAGFSNVSSTSNAFANSGNLAIAIPNGVAAGNYTGTLTGSLASSGCTATAAFSLTVFTSYTWTGGAGDNNWSTAGNWSPSRSTPASTDVLIFNGSTVASPSLTTLPSTQSFAQLLIQNGANVTLASGASAALTITNSLSVDATSTLTESTNTSITLSSGATTTLNGVFNVNAGTYTTTGVTTVSGSTAILRNGGGTISTGGVAANLLFVSGATYNHNINAGSIPTGTWASSGASTVLITGVTTTVPTNLNQTFYNITWTCASQTGAVTLGASGASPTMNASGTLTVNNTGSSTLQIISSSPGQTIANYVQHGGSVFGVSGQGSAGARTVTVTGSFTIDNTVSTSTYTLSNAPNVTSTAQLFVAGNFSVASGASITTSTLNSSTGEIRFNGTGGAQTVNVGSSAVLNVVGVTVSNTAGVSLSSSLTVPGTLTLTSGTLSVGANTLTVKGAVSVGSGLIDATTNASSAVAYNGSAAQSIAASTFTSATVSNLTINNSTGVTLNTPLSLTGTLTLTSGVLSTTSTNILTASSSATVPVGSSSSYINGPFAWSLPANYSTAGAKNFPVGASGYYGVVLTNPTVGASASVISVTAFNTSSGGSVTAPLALNATEYWSLTATGNFNGAASVKLSSASSSAKQDNAVAYSTTQTGAYTSLGATVAYPALTSTSAVPAGATLFFALQNPGALSYTWTGTASDNNWATATNWNPTRTTPAASDVLVFDGSTITFTSLPTESDDDITIKNGASVTFASGSSATLTFTGNLTVDATSTLTQSTNANILSTTGVVTSSGTITINAGTFTVGDQSPATISGTLNVNTGGTLAIAGTGTITVSGSSANLSNNGGTLSGISASSLFFTNSGTYTHNVNAGTIPTASWTSSGASTVKVTGTTSTFPTGFGQTFYNLTWQNAGQSVGSTLGATPVINGTFTVNNTGSSFLQMMFSSAGQTVANYVQHGGTVYGVNGQGSAGIRAVTVTGNFSIDNSIGTSSYILSNNPGVASTAQLIVKGNFSAAAGTITSSTANSSTGTIILSGTSGVQTITAGTSVLSVVGINVSNSSGATVLSNLSIPGTLTLTSGTLSVGANTLTLKGSITAGSGLIDATTNSSSVVVFNGSVAQTIAASTFTNNTFSNLTINNSAGVTLNTPITLTGTLSLTSGALTTTSTNILTAGSAATLPVGSITSYINGPLALSLPSNYNTAGAKNFPIGAGGNFYGLVLTSPTVGASSSVITVTANNSDCGGDPGSLTALNKSEFWSLIATGSFNGAGSVKLTSALAAAKQDNSVAYSTTQSGTYADLGGTVSYPTLTSTSAVPAGSAIYFALVNPGSLKYSWNGSASDNNWATASNWTPSRTSPQSSDILTFDGSTVAFTAVPAESDDQIILKNGANVTLANSSAAIIAISTSLSVDATSSLTQSTNTSINATGATVTVNGIYNINAGIFTVGISNTISGSDALLANNAGTISGASAANLFFTNGATYKHGITGGTIPTANWTSSGASTVNITGATNSSPAGLGQSFNNLTWNCTNQSSLIQFSAAPTAITGTLTVSSTGTDSLTLLASGTFGLTVGNYVQNGGTVQIVYQQGSTNNAGIRSLTVNGDFTLNNSSTFYINRSAAIAGAIGQLYVGGDLTASATSTIKASTGIATPTASIILNGTSAQNINFGATGVLSASSVGINLTVNNAAGVALGSNVTAASITLTSGKVTTTSSNLLSITNTATTAISGGSTTAFINGPVKWSLPANLAAGSTYVFPVGNASTFLPFSLVNPTTGTGAVTAQVVAVVGTTGGTVDNSTVISLGSTEYWQLVTTGNFTNAGISATQQSAISPLNTVAGSATLTGAYASLSGTVGTNGVTASSNIGTNRFFTFAKLNIVPNPPTSATAVDDNAQAAISYSAPTANAGTAVIDYTITAIPASGSSIVRTGITANPYTFTGLTNGVAYTFSVAARNAAGTGSTIVSNSITPSSTTTWNGTSWSATTPDASQSGVIAANLNSGSVNGTFSACAGLTVNAGVTYTLNAPLTIYGALVNNGTITGSGTITFAGTTAQSISGTGNVSNVTINNSNGVTIQSGSNNFGVAGVLTLQSGLLTTNGNLTFKSTSIANTGTFAPYKTGGNNGSISGTVTVERYIPAGFRAYRDMASQLSGVGTIYNNWQEGGNFTSGKGIFITGASATDANKADYTNQPMPNASGLDYSLNGINSAFTYSFPTFTAIANTKVTLDPFVGYRVLVRGDRSFNLATTPISNIYNYGLLMVNPTVLRSVGGKLITGTVTYNMTNASGTTSDGSSISSSAAALSGSSTSAFSVVANPYVSPVLWGDGTPSSASNTSTVFGNSTGINGSFWYLDPTYSATGTYLAYNALSGFSATGSSNTHVPTGYIQPGQAVFVQNFSSTSPVVKFTEATKAVSSTKTAVFGTTAPLSKIYVSIHKFNTTANSYSRVDGVAIAFNPSFGNAAYGPQDAIKFGNANDNLYISDKGKNLSIDGRLPATASDVLPIVITKPAANNYQLIVDASSYSSNGYSPVLQDNYKGTVKSLAAGIDTITFTVDSAIAASYSSRFSIAFKPTTLAVNSVVASASLNNKIATISWNTVGEKGVSRFEIEKSTDAISFTKIGQAIAKNTASASYSATDKNVTATSYYRVKAISEVGTVSYSNVAKVSITNYELPITFYPNPLKGGKVLNIAFDNVAAGKYTVTISNVLGQKVQEAAISHVGGNGSHAITVNGSLVSGTYGVTIRETVSGQLVHQSKLSVN